MNFKGWEQVSNIITDSLESNEMLNEGQKLSVHNLIKTLPKSGAIIADEVGMGKTRISVELINAVKKAGGRVLVVLPTTLGFQWQNELEDRDKHLKPKPIIRSLWGFLDAYKEEETAEPWANESVVLLSQNFANWRLGVSSKADRWALLPEIYGQYHKAHNGSVPRGYHQRSDLVSWEAEVCARNIVNHADKLPKKHVINKTLNYVINNFNWGMSGFDGNVFSAGSEYRTLLEKAVGLGLGAFDLVVIDEAHKSRGETSSLSTILNNIVLKTESTRNLAMTATPVELGVGQWEDMLSRIDLPKENRDKILEIVKEYAQIVSKLKQTWRADPVIRQQFKETSTKFQQVLSPYLFRRDKRQDDTIKAFNKVSGLPINAYRKQLPVNVEISGLSTEWKKIVCAVEGLSASSIMQTDSTSKRARLTLANGHGIAGIIDKSINSSIDDDVLEIENVTLPSKKEQRAQWWQSIIANSYQSGEESLYSHPAIIKVIEEIEKDLSKNQKALVFGKMTKPMRALVNLLNAREMLRSLQQEKYWPQSKIHTSAENSAESEELAVLAALKQLKLSWSIEEVNQKLAKQYNQHTYRIDKAKNTLVERIEEAKANVFDARTSALFDAFKVTVDSKESDQKANLMSFANAIFELIDKEGFDLSALELAQGFKDLMNVVTAKNEGDENGDGELDPGEANNLWKVITQRVANEFTHVRGGMARLMYGGTEAHSRRVMQLGFNRQNSFPKVVVAQSVVGREGLNLHQACRVVYLLHPEWNPGVVEQQIGRVDRLGSRWQREFEASQYEKKELPFIEIKPVIFKGTYDEYNWQVLDARWDELRSQLHGVILPESERSNGDEMLYDELCKAAPNFTPLDVK
ncbi:type III restriction endonuclease subunit R [Pseudoalteromonas sp. KS88]|uniref:SNF2-related protein n=1 Tax=Pseudoalteromonas sp. KS88 TaxID=2109918 RepID=UPI0010801A75|nr:SNF2-related protein [Pseudoalteromonas sp. KS88]TGE84808.1 type III restriction endonuclease subunit R [Pseudoalteromonas sp. KS88]